MKRMISAASKTLNDRLNATIEWLNEETGHTPGEVGSYTYYGGRGSVYLAIRWNDGGALKSISGFMSEKALISMIDTIIEVLRNEK